MLKNILIVLSIMCFSELRAQEKNLLYKTKKILPTNDTIHLEKVSINSSRFKILDQNMQPIDTSLYRINFGKSTLVFKNSAILSSDSLTVEYLKFPDEITKEYRIYDPSRIVKNSTFSGLLYSSEENYVTKIKPLDGLNTSGSISRGVTIGNNQNSVLNSNLDLQITGKLSDKVSLRASLQDNNIPLQNGGYSQKLDQFDNIFMELFSDKWNIRAGDVFIENHNTQFLNFNKKAQGLSTQFEFGEEDNKTTLLASAALVRGQYARSNFVGQEGNQGPYKLIGKNGELYVLVISGSERVFANGILLARGENKDYTIDYNAGEILFTPLFTITSEMRISVEYQYLEQNYTRFVSHAGALHHRKKWSLGGYFYSESDLKNQPAQQTLGPAQVDVLKNAGDINNLMVAPSAYLDSYSESKILYKKTIVGGSEIFVYSTEPSDELYNVRFSKVAANTGNYILKDAFAVGRIYEYVEPVAGILQGSYSPEIRLVAPIKTQVATFVGKYNPSEKTIVDIELGVSNNDKNLFSTIDDADNQSLATKINAKQRLLSKKIQLDATTNYQFIHKNFGTVERLYNIEFNRDWNLSSTILGNQRYWVSSLIMEIPSQTKITYQFEKLDFKDLFGGNRHILVADAKLKNWQIQNFSSYLKSDGAVSTSKFIRNKTGVRHNFKKNWVSGHLNLEDNQETDIVTSQLSSLSQRFIEQGLLIGRGDTTKVYAELAYYNRLNDSLVNSNVQRVNKSRTFALKSRIIQTIKSELSIFANYRVLDFIDPARINEPTLNSRIIYNDRFLKQFVQSGTVFETNSGSIAQQEFTYIEVPDGQGVYTWKDYNGDQIQQLEEFEVAPFVDQAKFIRVFLPNQVFIKTNQNKFSQSITLNPNLWLNKTGIKKFLSHFYDQISYLVDRKIKNLGNNFDLNPFASFGENILGLNSSFRNSLFFNRGKQYHSVTYSYIDSKGKNLLSVGSIENVSRSHQVQYNHLYAKSWLFGFFTKTIKTKQESENYPERNFDISGYQLAPKISYLFSKSTSWDIFYEFQKKNNITGTAQSLSQNRLGTSYSYAGDKKFTLNGEFSFYNNKYIGNEVSAVGFQMLEGLQSGKNMTWKLLFQKKLTSFLDFNVNYQGRKSETSKAIHTGNVQLRAYF